MKVAATDAEFQALLTEKELLAVHFTAGWSSVCKLFTPRFEELAEKFPSVVCLKVDIETTPKPAQMYGIRSIPTFMFFKKGQMDGIIVGTDMKSVENKLKDLTA